MPTQPKQQQRQGQQQAQRAVVPQPTQEDRARMAVVAVSREIDNRLAIVEASAAAGIKADRLKLVALSAFTRSPQLMECTPITVARSIVEAAQVGLEPTGLLGGAYLVPRAGQCTLLIGYRGLVMLAMRSQLVQRVEARIVREKDEFDYGYGLEPYLQHRPSRDADPGPITYAYAVIFYRDGSRQFDVMSHAEIEVIRKRNGGGGSSGPWVTDYAEMCKKTPLRRLMKMAPLTVEVAAKLDELDPEVIEGTAVAVDSAVDRQRSALQAALAHEYGGQEPEAQQQPAPAQEEPVEGQVREVPTTQAGGDAGQAPAQSEAGAPASAAQGTTTPEPAASPAPAPAATCGVVDEKLGAGPCVLPAGHREAMWRDGKGTALPPQQEHQEAGGTMWSTRR
jgi:recombination protein RecT